MAYKLKYNISFEHGEFTREQLGGDGGTDALMVVSILRYGYDLYKSPKSIAFFGVDGADAGADGIPDTDVFQVFTNLACHLMDLDTIPKWQKRIAATTFAAVKAVVARGRR